MARITKDTIIEDILNIAPDAVPILAQNNVSVFV